MTVATATAGRRRSDTTRDRVLAAAFGLLCERGYSGMAVEAVAARAGAGKATIYRWWPDRAALAVDAFFAATIETLAFPDTGLAREDFRLQVLQLADLLRGPTGAAMAAMVAGARVDPALGRAIGERWVAPRKRWGVARLERARADSEVRPGVDTDAALNAIYSPLYAPLLLGLGVESPPRIDAYLAIVFAGIFR